MMAEMREEIIVVAHNIKLQLNAILIETKLTINQQMELFFQLYHCMKTFSYKNDSAISQMEKCQKWFSDFTVLSTPLSQTSQIVDVAVCERQGLAVDVTKSESLQSTIHHLVNEPITVTVTETDSKIIVPKLDALSREQAESSDSQNKQDIIESPPHTSTKQHGIRPKRACTLASKNKVWEKKSHQSKPKTLVRNVKSVTVADVVKSTADGGSNDDDNVDAHVEPDADDVINLEEVDEPEDSKSGDNEQVLKESGECQYKQDQYICKHCSYSTNKKYNLIRHARKHDTVNKLYKCTICDVKSFENEQHLDDHMVNIHKLNSDTTIPCTYCGKFYSSKSVLLRHLVRHKKPKINCPHCTKEFISRIGLQKHIALKHDMTAKYRCKLCGKLYDRKVLLEEHLVKHSGQSPYTCLYCKKEYSTRRFFLGHLKRCQNVIGKIPALYEKKDNEFSCKICDYRSKRLFDMRRHEMRHKIDGRPTCVTCGKSYSCISTLKEHVSTCHNNIKFICYVCGKTFNARACMNRHISKVHDKKFRHKCHICGKQFFEKLSYRDHMDSHTGTRSHVCHFCGLSYRYKPRLMVHMRKHRDYPQYQCAHCDKQYSTSDSLSQHVAAKHTRDKHWICELCGKKFEWNSSYTWHRKKSCPMLQKPLVV